INSLTVHPLMLLSLWNTKTMSSDIRLGYFLTEICLIAHDWCWNFSLRMYPCTPYSAFYCGGPACRLIDSRPIIMVPIIISTTITANIPCFLFLLMRTHKQANT
ncbi:hypothetical protein PENTCL1PPCAC_14796, partial [Pristionchus entomophagus]